MNRIQQTAEALCRRCGSRDPYQIAEELNIELLRYPFARLNGMALQHEGGIAVALRAGLDPAEERYILAHELGHIMLHPASYFTIRDHTSFFTPKYEKEADLFAAYLLVDELPEEEENILAFSERKNIPPFLLELLFS